MKVTLRRPQILLNLSILLVLFISSCTLSPSPSPPPISVKKIANKITDGVGQVTQTSEGDPTRRVIVFEELHSSRANQVEIAVMLNRLYEDYNLRSIGQEGAFKNEKLVTPWSYSPPPFKAKNPIRKREDVIVQLLEEGEISSSETMALIYQDIQVVGIENPKEYSSDELTSGAATAGDVYLYKIALEGMTLDELNHALTLSGQERFDYVISKNAWTKEEYAFLHNSGQIISVEEWSHILDEIEAKATNAQITPEDETNLQSLRKYYNIASMRSKTMVNNTLDVLKLSPNGLVAMVIGAAHTQGVTKLLTEAKISFAVIRGISLNNEKDSSQLSSWAYDRKASSPPLSIDAPGMLGSFLDNRTKKPRPVITTPWFQSKYAIFETTVDVAHLAAAGIKTLSPAELSQLPKFENVKIDPKSFRKDGDDVIFSVTAPNEENKSVTIWVRTRVVGTQSVDELLNTRLLEGYKHVKDDSSESESGERESKEIAISEDTKAIFSPTELGIMNSKISSST